LARGASATQSAHRAGFSDAAHMSRRFRRMQGATPAAMSCSSPPTTAAVGRAYAIERDAAARLWMASEEMTGAGI
jgi:AraC-like DNA-binding protein